ncbi:MAG: CBS domain-containing protein [Deltaproteobacteria bacterium]|nr:CBS domain-containing protein [Deltaproteobacteria bacterium]
MLTVRELLAKKGSQVWSVSPDATVYEALQLMAEQNVGAVLVMSGRSLAGILSERDYARQVVLKGKGSRDTPVREIMTTRLVCVAPERTIEHCMALMTENRIRHLPVMAGEALVGLLSIGDVVKAVISEKQFLIEQLEGYIATSG